MKSQKKMIEKLLDKAERKYYRLKEDHANIPWDATGKERERRRRLEIELERAGRELKKLEFEYAEASAGPRTNPRKRRRESAFKEYKRTGRIRGPLGRKKKKTAKSIRAMLHLPKKNPIPVFLSLIGQGAGTALGADMASQAYRKATKSSSSSKRKTKRVKSKKNGKRISGKTFAQKAREIRELGFLSRRAREILAPHLRLVREKKKSSNNPKRAKQRITHAVALGNRIISVGSRRVVEHDARLLRKAGKKPRIGRRI